jgi:putative DNA primase/helicase
MSARTRRPQVIPSPKASHANGSRQSHPRDDETVDLTYTYEGENGNPLRQVRRVDCGDGTSEFCQFCHTDLGWKRGVRGVRDIPYRLPQLLKAITDGDRIFVVRGEECVSELTAQGVVATTNPEGVEEWPEPLQQYFQGARVVLLPANDEPGHQHMARVEENLAPVVSSLKVVELPGLGEGENVSDWLDRGGNRQELLRLANTTPTTIDSPEIKASLKRTGSSTWDIPQPLDPRPSLPPFPLEALPGFLSNYVTAVSESTQTPVDLAGILALAVTAAATSGLRIRVRPGFTVPLNLYLVVVLAVGEGKSPVYREMMQVLERIEAELQNEAAPAISEAKARKTVAEANLNAIKKRLASPKLSSEDRLSLTSQVKEAQVAFEEISVPYPPRLYTQDATPEGLLKGPPGMNVGDFRDPLLADARAGGRVRSARA